MTAVYTKEDVAKHSTATDLWTVIDGDVYDLTEFADMHPGSFEVKTEGGESQLPRSPLVSHCGCNTALLVYPTALSPFT